MNHGAAVAKPTANPARIAHIQAFFVCSCNPHAITISIIMSAIPLRRLTLATIVVWTIKARIRIGNANKSSTAITVKEWESADLSPLAENS